jgi:3-oxoacyl-[acyl-carrier-protein] synthase III
MNLGDIKWFIFYQANMFILQYLQKKYCIKLNKF